MNLTSAAIEAAAKSLHYDWDTTTEGFRSAVRERVRDALEAAAPHMCLDRPSQRTEWPDIPRSRA